MEGGFRERVRASLARIRRFERRELHDLRRWLEQTENVIHVSILLIVPLLLAAVTYLSNALSAVSFLVYPPLASGAITLFGDPEGKYASVKRFVGGLTAGAICGWVAIILGTTLFYEAVPGRIHAPGAAISMFLTGAVTWLLDIEEPSAFSTALLTLFVHARIDRPGVYVLSIAVSSALVAGAFAVWRRTFYEQRDRYLYESTSGDDHVLVPMRGRRVEQTAMLAARLAAAHRAGKVVLMDIVEQEWLAEAERTLLQEHGSARMAVSASGAGDVGDLPDDETVVDAVNRLEERAHAVETEIGVPCEVVVAVAGQSPARTVLRTAERANCDLVVTPYEEQHGRLSPFVQELFSGDKDVLAHRSEGGRTAWNRVLVPVRRASGVANGMVDFAVRLAGKTGFVSVATCCQTDRELRRGEEMLANLVEPFEGHIEARAAETDIEDFLARNAHEYDLVIMGASQDRSMVSRLVSPPTFERIGDLDADVAIVDRA